MNRAGGRRGPAEYVGAGRIGAIWIDPDRAEGSRKAWYCAIEDYTRFSRPVAAKHDGVTLEDIRSNLWRDGVRSLAPVTYQQIMNLAAAQPSLESAPPDIRTLEIATSDALILPPAPGTGGSVQHGGYRRAKKAKVIGDWAEAIVVRYLKEQVAGCQECVHRAANSETPGWDIDYRDAAGVLQRVEVKGTVAGGFIGIELTAQEMRAAETHREAYWLYLVAGCLTDSPKVQAVQNPAAQIAGGMWSASPSLFAVRFSEYAHYAGK